MKTKQKGFTLIEVIISIAILSIFSILLATLFFTGFNGIMRSGNKAVATYESQMEITKIMSDTENLEPGKYDKDRIEIDFADGPTIRLDIRIIKSEVDVRGSKAIIKTFFLEP